MRGEFIDSESDYVHCIVFKAGEIFEQYIMYTDYCIVTYILTCCWQKGIKDARLSQVPSASWRLTSKCQHDFVCMGLCVVGMKHELAPTSCSLIR